MMLALAFSTLSAGEIRIAVAANVSYAIEALKKEFHVLHPHTKVQVILGSSGKLTAQIKHGAPYMLFLSANMQYPRHSIKRVTRSQNLWSMLRVLWLLSL